MRTFVVILLAFALAFPCVARGNGKGVSLSGGSPYWIANDGQWEGDFSFKCEVGSAVYYVTPKGMTVDFREYTRHARTVGAQHAVPDPDAFYYRRPPAVWNVAPSLMGKNPRSDSVSVHGHVVQIHCVTSGPLSPQGAGKGRDRGSEAVGTDKLSHYSNYFLGRDSCNWRSRVSHYESVIVKEVWEGIDVEYRADRQGVETVFHVKPGANVGQIQMEYIGLDAPLQLDSQGNLILETSLGEIKEESPFAFQQNRRIQESVGARFQIGDGNQISYALDLYDSTKEVVIDPLLHGTYIGGRDPDHADDIATTSDGRVVVCGGTDRTTFLQRPVHIKRILVRA